MLSKTYTRSSKVSLKFSNTGKLEELFSFIYEYEKIVLTFIDLIWNLDKLPNFASKDFTSKIVTSLSARTIQAAGKQASSMVRGTKVKQQRRLFIYNKLLEENKLVEAEKLKKIIDDQIVSKPIFEHINPLLDSRFVKFDFDSSNSFDLWITLSSFQKKIKLVIPFKKTKHLNKMLKKGKLLRSIQISKKDITLFFEFEKKKSLGTKSIGIDIGSNNLITTSENFKSLTDKDGWDLSKIMQKLMYKKKGSKGFQKTVNHRKNFINWSVNQLNLTNIKEIKLENWKNANKFKNIGKFLKHFTYTEILNKLALYCEEAGVQIIIVNRAYSSLRCSECGWVCVRNRKKSNFKCMSCGFTLDADLNASINISQFLPLSYNNDKAQQNFNKEDGFFYSNSGKKSIVSFTQKLHNISIL